MVCLACAPALSNSVTDVDQRSGAIAISAQIKSHSKEADTSPSVSYDHAHLNSTTLQMYQPGFLWKQEA